MDSIAAKKVNLGEQFYIRRFPEPQREGQNNHLNCVKATVGIWGCECGLMSRKSTSATASRQRLRKILLDKSVSMLFNRVKACR